MPPAARRSSICSPTTIRCRVSRTRTSSRRALGDRVTVIVIRQCQPRGHRRAARGDQRRTDRLCPRAVGRARRAESAPICLIFLNAGCSAPGQSAAGLRAWARPFCGTARRSRARCWPRSASTSSCKRASGTTTPPTARARLLSGLVRRRDGRALAGADRQSDSQGRCVERSSTGATAGGRSSTWLAFALSVALMGSLGFLVSFALLTFFLVAVVFRPLGR